jgi:hypothetical protein
MERFDRRNAITFDQVLATPRIDRFVYTYVMSAREQFRYNTTQEMCIAVIPIGNQGVVE